VQAGTYPHPTVMVRKIVALCAVLGNLPLSSIFIMNPIYDLRRSASKYYAAADGNNRGCKIGSQDRSRHRAVKLRKNEA